QRGIEAAPEHDPGEEPAQGEEAQAQVPRRRVELPPEAARRADQAAQRPHCRPRSARAARSARSRVSMSSNRLSTRGAASAWTTWHCTQKYRRGEISARNWSLRSM